MIDKTLKRVRNYDLIPRFEKKMVHIKELEKVLMKSLDFGFLFASKIFDINDAIKAFYQFLGMKKNILGNIFNLGFLEALKKLEIKKNVFEKESMVFNKDSEVISKVYSHLKGLQDQKFPSIPKFIEIIKLTLNDLKQIKPRLGLEFLSKSHYFLKIKILYMPKNLADLSNLCII